MCGRYASISTATELAAVFGIDEIRGEQLPIRYNVAPTQPVYAVADGRPGGPDQEAPRQLGSFRWGLVPSWAKDLAVGAGMINARSEGIATKPAFRDALVRRRCLIPADAFYEWQAQPSPQPALAGFPERDRPSVAAGKRPYAIKPRTGRPMAFAGLWEVWRPPTGPDPAPVRTCTIITTAANSLLAPIHHRMPVVLDPASWDFWLDRSNHDIDGVVELLVPAPPGDFVVHPVSSRVNRADNDDSELLDPVDVA
ncbi:MAG TPA: SOS response-associated peptidase [Acidimicrobiales bacterium]